MKAMIDGVMPAEHTEWQFVGKSQAVHDVLALVEKIAPVDVTVLVLGESGSGKELIARQIHTGSRRRDQPFVAVNCAAIPDTLVESELFGHEKGAFTGAISRRKGSFEQAHGGTLFLDEIGDMTPEAQAKVLRGLEDRSFTPVGAQQRVQVDVRVVAASNKNLLARVQQGQFRSDLYYRLNEVKIDLPPLRQRIEDIPLLVDFFIAVFNRQFGKSVRRMSDAALSYLLRHAWPGNVRELRNVVKHAVAVHDGDTIWLEHLPFEITLHTESSPQPLSLDTVLKQHIAAVLRKTDWNKSLAASILQISRPRLDRKIRDYQLIECNDTLQ